MTEAAIVFRAAARGSWAKELTIPASSRPLTNARRRSFLSRVFCLRENFPRCGLMEFLKSKGSPLVPRSPAALDDWVWVHSARLQPRKQADRGNLRACRGSKKTRSSRSGKLKHRLSASTCRGESAGNAADARSSSRPDWPKPTADGVDCNGGVLILSGQLNGVVQWTAGIFLPKGELIVEPIGRDIGRPARRHGRQSSSISTSYPRQKRTPAAILAERVKHKMNSRRLFKRRSSKAAASEEAQAYSFGTS